MDSGHTNTEILVRLERIRDEVIGIEQMVENGAPCPEVLSRILAVQSALADVKQRVLRCHLHAALQSIAHHPGPEMEKRLFEQLVQIYECRIKY